MTFRIVYMDGRRFKRSSAFAPVLRLAVGESTPTGRYRSAGYRSITRVT